MDANFKSSRIFMNRPRLPQVLQPPDSTSKCVRRQRIFFTVTAPLKINEQDRSCHSDTAYRYPGGRRALKINEQDRSCHSEPFASLEGELREESLARWARILRSTQNDTTGFMRGPILLFNIHPIFYINLCNSSGVFTLMNERSSGSTWRNRSSGMYCTGATSSSERGSRRPWRKRSSINGRMERGYIASNTWGTSFTIGTSMAPVRGSESR